MAANDDDDDDNYDALREKKRGYIFFYRNGICLLEDSLVRFACISVADDDDDDEDLVFFLCEVDSITNISLYLCFFSFYSNLSFFSKCIRDNQCFLNEFGYKCLLYVIGYQSIEWCGCYDVSC